MGIFSSEYRSYSVSIATPMMEKYDDPLPGIVAGSFLTNTDLVSNLLNYAADGWYQRSEKYYRYGRDHFARGLPEDIQVRYEIDVPGLRSIIEREVDSKIQFIAYSLHVATHKHFVNQYLQDVRKMNPNTNAVTVNPPGLPPGSGDVTYIGFFVENGFVVIRYSFHNNESGPGIHNESVSYPYNERIAYEVEYKLMTSANETIEPILFWTYFTGTGTYPRLEESPFQEEQGSNGYYPIVPFYEDKIQIGDPANAGTPLYDTSRKLVNKLGFKYEDLVEKLAEGTEESIGKDKGLYAYLYMAVSATSGLPDNYLTSTMDERIAAIDDAQPSLNYLIDYYMEQSLRSLYTKAEYDSVRAQAQPKSYPRQNSIFIRDESFNTELLYYYIDVKYINTVIGNVGRCSVEYFPGTFYVYDNEGQVASNGQDASMFLYTRQETPTSCVRVEIRGLSQRVKVINSRDYLSNSTQAFEPDEDDRVKIVIPLDRNIVLKSPSKFRNRLIHASLHFVFNAYQRVEIKWYQTFAWKFIFTAIALYLSIPSGGLSTGAVSSLLTIQGLRAAAYAMLIMYLRYVIFKIVIKVIAKEFGVEFAFILSIAAMAYGKFGNMSGFNKLPWAEDMLSIGGTIWNVSNEQLQDEYKDVLRDYNGFNAEARKQQEELDRARKLLDTDADIDPWLFVNPMPDLLMSESADSFIQLRKSSVSLGVSVLQAPTAYVDNMLALPTIDDTIPFKIGN